MTIIVAVWYRQQAPKISQKHFPFGKFLNNFVWQAPKTYFPCGKRLKTILYVATP